MRCRIAILVALVAVGPFLAACSDDSPTEYDAEAEDRFMQICLEQGGDAENDGLEPVCQCAYDKFREGIPFDDFWDFVTEIEDDPEAAIPDEFAERFSDCVLEAGPGAGATPTLPPTTTTAPPPTAAPTTLPGASVATTAPPG